MGCDGLRVELMMKLGSSADGELPHWLQMYLVLPGLHPSAEKHQFHLNWPKFAVSSTDLMAFMLQSQ